MIDPHPDQPRSFPRAPATACLALALLAAAARSEAQVTVDATVTPLGGSFRYDLTIHNHDPQELALVSLTDAPLNDGLIDPSLAVPPGFLGSYDSVLGFVDFLADSSPFTSGGTFAGFSFQSYAGPGAFFREFEALTIAGDPLSGSVQVTVVPEAGALVGATSLLGLLAGAELLRRRRQGRDEASGKTSFRRPLLASLCVSGLLGVATVPARASSHSDAPLIKQDPQANLTDVYAFVGSKYNDPTKKVLNVLVSVRPFSDPGDGVIFERFADDAQYSIHITHPATGQTLERYDFQFSSVTGGVKNPDTTLSYGLGTEVGPIQTIGDARQNFTQTYDLFRNGVLIGDDLPVPPPNVGRRTTPAYNDPTTGLAISGATTAAELDSLTQQAVKVLPGGQVAFAGPRDDGFYADTPGIFDLLDGRIVANLDGDASNGLGRDGGGIDGFKGFNVLSYALQLDVSSLPSLAYTDPFFGPASGVGVYASVSRKRTRLLKADGEPVNSGPWVQVNRLGNPLFNEVLVALKDKDKYNRTSPPADAQFATYAENPELATLINVVFGTSFPATGRTELRAIYIPDVVRVNTATDPVKLPGQAGFSRLSLLGGDLTTGVSASGGWPNGRRIGDDVVDIALTAVSALTVDLGDNVNANDQVYNQVFPYLATPHAGPTVTQRSAP